MGPANEDEIGDSVAIEVRYRKQPRVRAGVEDRRYKRAVAFTQKQGDAGRAATGHREIPQTVAIEIRGHLLSGKRREPRTISQLLSAEAVAARHARATGLL